MGKRSKIIKAIKANPERFIEKPVIGGESATSVRFNDGVMDVGYRSYTNHDTHKRLVRATLLQLGYREYTCKRYHKHFRR